MRAVAADSLSRITFIWTAATATSVLLLPIFGLSTSPYLGLNDYAVMVMGAVILDAMIGH